LGLEKGMRFKNYDVGILTTKVNALNARFVARLASGKEARLTKDGVPFNYCGVELYAPLVEVANKALPKVRRTFVKFGV
jgi:hypothetical protein